jgi:hypothetical protein
VSVVERIANHVRDALCALDSDELARRVAWCRDNDRHGVTVVRDADELVFLWAGEELSRLDRRALMRGIGTTADLS